MPESNSNCNPLPRPDERAQIAAKRAAFGYPDPIKALADLLLDIAEQQRLAEAQPPPAPPQPAAKPTKRARRAIGDLYRGQETNDTRK